MMPQRDKIGFHGQAILNYRLVAPGALQYLLVPYPKPVAWTQATMKLKPAGEDGIAILFGAGFLLLGLLAWLLLPVALDLPGAGRAFSSLLQAMMPEFSRWTFNPLDAFALQSWLAFAGLTLVLGALHAPVMPWLGQKPRAFLQGFVVLSLLALLANVLGNQADFRSYGLGYALWAIALGLVISNAFGIPQWLRPALQHELYVKTGLVLLGAEVLFGKILAIGLPGIFVAWVTTPIVLVTTYWFGQKILKIESKTLNITVSADMSVCGVSAAIATAAACRAKKEELTTAIGLSMVFTAFMMVALPAFIQAMGMPEVLGGAWIGGTIDATGAVVAAGAFLGDTARDVAATIKMIQNILIGVIAFAVAVYWSTRVERGSVRSVGAAEIWQRFPKFVLGFLGASVLFSSLHASLDTASRELLEAGLLDWSGSLRDWLFCLAFASIGLSTNFAELRRQFRGGRPLLLYVCGQSLNLCLTLLMAWLMFYKVFPEVTGAL